MTKYLIAAFFVLIFTLNVFSQSNEYAINTALVFLSNLENGDFEANKQYMAQLYATQDFSKKLADTWQFQQQQLGQYKNLKSTKYDNFRDYEIVYLTCEFEKSDYTIKLVYNNKQELTDIYFIPYPPIIAAGDLNRLWLILFFILWELAWKAMGLWKAGKNQKVAWFLCIFIFPTFGVLPIIYTLFVREHKL